MKLRVVRALKYSPEELKRLDRILDLFLSSVNSVDFRERILDHEKFITKHNLSNAEIYQTIMDANEEGANGGVDEEADLDLTLDLRTSSDVIGFSKDGRIFTFRNLFHQLEIATLAGHYSHEFCHTLGFADPADMSKIHLNVPYEVGNIIENISNSLSNRTIISVDLPEEEILPDGNLPGGMLSDFNNTVIIPGTIHKRTLRNKLRLVAKKIRTRKRKAKVSG